MSEELGIKELSEIIEGLGEIAGFAGAVLQDGKVGADDIVHLVELGSKFEKLADAVKDADQAIDEAKNLKQDEVLALIGLIYGAVDKFAKAKKGA